jgi:hypothetical protein
MTGHCIVRSVAGIGGDVFKIQLRPLLEKLRSMFRNLRVAKI